MENTELTKKLAGQGVNTAINARGDKDELAALKIILVLIGLLGFVGKEGNKVVFRTNFGVQAINMLQVTACSLLFIALSIFTFYFEGQYPNDPGLHAFGSQSSFLITSVICLLIAVYIFQKGLSERAKANKQLDPHHGGNTVLFKFLIKEGWSERKVQTVAEPLFLISLGVLALSYNVLLGSPLIWCGFSQWIAQFVNRFWGGNPTKQILEEKGYKPNTTDSFSEVQS